MRFSCLPALIALTFATVGAKTHDVAGLWKADDASFCPDLHMRISKGSTPLEYRVTAKIVNTMSFVFSWTDENGSDVLPMGPMSSTMMAGPSELMQQETKFSQFISEVYSVYVDYGECLVFAGLKGSLIFIDDDGVLSNFFPQWKSDYIPEENVEGQGGIVVSA